MAPLVSIFLPLAVDLIRSYIKSSDSSKDDQILNVVQDGCKYLAPKNNNDLALWVADDVQKIKMIGEAE